MSSISAPDEAPPAKKIKSKRPLNAMRATRAALGIDPRGGRNGELVYSPELADLICERMTGGDSLHTICSEPGMPTSQAVLGWHAKNLDGFALKYARAREALMDAWAEDLIKLADNGSMDPNDRRVRLDTRKWLMSKLAARRYGDKIVHSGDAENPIRVLHGTTKLNDLSVSELDALEQFASARLTAIDIEHEPSDSDETS